MKRDLASRAEPSVYYSTDAPALPPASSLLLNNNLNNVRLNLDTQARLANPRQLPAMVKNVNVDNFKLGMAREEDGRCGAGVEERGCGAGVEERGCGAKVELGKCSAGVDEEEEARLTEQQVTDINVFLGEVAGQGKVGKSDLEKMIRNNLGKEATPPQGAAALPTLSEDPFADFESKLNV